MHLYISALCTLIVGILHHDDWDSQSTYEPDGSEPIITTVCIPTCASFRRTFNKSKWVMGWIDNICDLVWQTIPPVAKETPNSKSALEHYEFFIKAISEMVEASTVPALPTGVLNPQS